uniref:Putative ovule protein n=1 Tax=Solanum chacoense TaxID=4108 RepID=A0A0V0HHX2_SOLCH
MQIYAFRFLTTSSSIDQDFVPHLICTVCFSFEFLRFFSDPNPGILIYQFLVCQNVTSSMKRRLN